MLHKIFTSFRVISLHNSLKILFNTHYTNLLHRDPHSRQPDDVYLLFLFASVLFGCKGGLTTSTGTAYTSLSNGTLYRSLIWLELNVSCDTACIIKLESSTLHAVGTERELCELESLDEPSEHLDVGLPVMQKLLRDSVTS